MQGSYTMKSATLPPLRVEPALRDAACALLQEGETLSAFVEHAVRAQITLRRSQADFVTRGLLAGERAARTGRYVSAEKVMDSLTTSLESARAAPRR